jgi:flagellar biosynthesis protein FliP
MEKVEKEEAQKGKQMNRNVKIAILITILLVAAATAVLIASYQIEETAQHAFPFGPGYYTPNPGDRDFYYVARTVFSTINIVLLVFLITNYAHIYLKTKSEFTIGLMLFGVFFLIKDIFWSPFLIQFVGFNMLGRGPFAFLPDLFELIGLTVLVFLTVEY